jgi:hypothetical protein
MRDGRLGGGTVGGGTGHLPPALLERYVGGGAGLGADAVWAVEVHLEGCAGCRDRLGEVVARRSPATTLLLEQVWTGLAAEVARSPRTPSRRRRLPGRLSRWARWWATPALLPRLGMTVLVVLAAVGLDLADAAGSGRYPSLVLLLAPVAPLLAVAAAWSRGSDPAYELVVASPRAGLDLVLRRTMVVVLAVIPALVVGGWLVGVSPARWLLPCLAFTAGALALGEVVGLQRASTGLALGWAAVVVGPSLVTARPPVLLAAASLPGWAAAIVVVAMVLVVRRGAYTGLASGR